MYLAAKASWCEVWKKFTASMELSELKEGRKHERISIAFTFMPLHSFEVFNTSHSISCLPRITFSCKRQHKLIKEIKFKIKYDKQVGDIQIIHQQKIRIAPNGFELHLALWHICFNALIKCALLCAAIKYNDEHDAPGIVCRMTI